MHLFTIKNSQIIGLIGLITICSSYAMNNHATIVNMSAYSLNKSETAYLQELTNAWKTFYKENNYRSLMASSPASIEGCGSIHDLKNSSILIARPYETGCIADMTQVIGATEPHFHRNEAEVYFILQGTGIVVIGKQEYKVNPGDVIYIPKLLGHYTVPTKDLVLGVVNIPYFDQNNLFDLREADETTRTAVNYDHARYLHHASQKES